MAQVVLCPSTFSPAKQLPEYQTPSIAWLTHEWHVTHSSLPMWKSKRNVRIRYTPLEPSQTHISRDNTDRLDDLVSYQSLDGEKLHTVHGVDKCTSSGEARGEWDWRGKGLLKIASSHWEVLGWGEEESTGNKWVVTVFAKTFATPAGVDVYSGVKSGLHAETLEQIKAALARIEDEDVKKMAGELFEVRIDETRKD